MLTYSSEIDRRLQREAAGLRSPRVIVLRHRMMDASSAPITVPAAHRGSLPEHLGLAELTECSGKPAR
jgi:hypothetical protein